MRGFVAAHLHKAPLKTLHRLVDVAANEAVGAAEVKHCALGSMVVCVSAISKLEIAGLDTRLFRSRWIDFRAAVIAPDAMGAAL